MFDGLEQTVLQCLYSQCHTAQFGSALHSTITRCSDYSSLVPDVLPPLIRHQGLRRRASSDNVQVSARPQASARPGAALASVTLSHSVQRRSVSASATASLIRSSRPTMLISPVQTFSGGMSHRSYPSLCGAFLESHTKYCTALPAF